MSNNSKNGFDLRHIIEQYKKIDSPADDYAIPPERLAEIEKEQDEMSAYELYCMMKAIEIAENDPVNALEDIALKVESLAGTLTYVCADIEGYGEGTHDLVSDAVLQETLSGVENELRNVSKDLVKIAGNVNELQKKASAGTEAHVKTPTKE